jgi:hypothetical protein
MVVLGAAQVHAQDSLSVNDLILLGTVAQQVKREDVNRDGYIDTIDYAVQAYYAFSTSERRDVDVVYVRNRTTRRPMVALTYKGHAFAPGVLIEDVDYDNYDTSFGGKIVTGQMWFIKQGLYKW